MSLKLKFWGASGSIPAPLETESLEEKILAALRLAKGRDFQNEDSLKQFLGELPFPLRGTYKGNTNCIQIFNKTNGIFLCDAGSGLRAFSDSLRKAQPTNTYHFFLTHLHWDHIQGLPFFKPAYQAGNEIIIHTLHEEAEDALRQMMKPPYFPASYDSLAANIEFDLIRAGSSFKIGDLNVRTLLQDHPNDSYAFRFEEEGQAIVISTDSQHPDDVASDSKYPFLEFFKAADLLVFDGQYSLDNLHGEKRTWGHSDAVTAVEIAAVANVKQLVLTHHDPANADLEIHKILAIAEKHRSSYRKAAGSEDLYPMDIKLAYDGLTVEA